MGGSRNRATPNGRGIRRYLEGAVQRYHEDEEPLSENVSAWVAHLGEVLGLQVTVYDRDKMEANWRLMTGML